MNFFHKFFRTRHVQTSCSTEYEKRHGHVAMATEKVLHCGILFDRWLARLCFHIIADDRWKMFP